MNLRPATPADLNLLQYWDEQPHVIDSNPNDKWDWEVELQQNFDWIESPLLINHVEHTTQPREY